MGRTRECGKKNIATKGITERRLQISNKKSDLIREMQREGEYGDRNE